MDVIRTEGIWDNPPKLPSSGISYVSAKLRADTELMPRRIPIRSERRCQHIFTICADCASSWAEDYNLLLVRTKGGTELAKKLA